MAGLAAPAAADPAIWTVKGPRASVSIVGSTVSVPADGRWKTQALHDAAANAQELWFITPFGGPNPFILLHAYALMKAKGNLPTGETLSAKLSPEGRERLARIAARDHIAMAELDRMRPWAAQVNISYKDRQRDGTIQGLPVERYVVQTAPRDDPKRGFDRLDDDLKLLIALPASEQIYNLEESMRRLDDPAENPRYGKAWAEGDLGWIEQERDEKLRRNAPVTYRTMQLEPRTRWADQIAKLANGSKNVLVVVDAGNTVGQNGLPALLRRKGLHVDGP